MSINKSINTRSHCDFAVFIGRFQPFHRGHEHVIRAGLAAAGQMIVLIGSAWQPTNARNPFTHQQREAMIRASFGPAENRRLHCLPLMDVPYNDELWVRNVQATVNGIVTAHHATPHRPARIALIGHAKDHTGFYLRLFPRWDNIAVDNHRDISATPLRERFFADTAAESLVAMTESDVLPEGTVSILRRFAGSDPDFRRIRDEIEFIRGYRASWAQAPYEPTFVTVDAVVVQSGHILLIRRRARPGEGLLALPGGFVRSGERLEAACLRELREETRLKVPEAVLKGSIQRREVFDEPHRSTRGRTITHAFYIELQPATALPHVKGGDDARSADWVPLAELDPAKMFEDHYFIIQELVGLGLS